MAAHGPVSPGGPPSGAAGGDLGGTYPNPDVEAIDGVVLSGVAPSSGQVLTATGPAAAGWAPSPAAPVTSVFSRTGVVVAGNADYLAVPSGGLTGAVAATRYVGGTASVAPTTGTFAVADFVISQTGHVYVCTVAGTPGTWVDAGSLGNLVTSVFGRAGAVVAANGDYTAAQVGALASTATLNAIATANATAADVAMNSHKITGLTNGSLATDAAAFGQIPTVGSLLVSSAGSGSQSSASFTALGTSATVTATTGTKALVIISGVFSAGTNSTGALGVAVSGASAIAATAVNALQCNLTVATTGIAASYVIPMLALTAGSNVFTAQLAANGATSISVSSVFVTVIPIN